MTTGDLPPLDVSHRLGRLRERLATDATVEGLLVTELVNVRYLSGFTGSAGILLVAPHGALLLTDGRYRTQAAEELRAAGLDGEVELVIGNHATQQDALGGRISSLRLANVGLEDEHVSWAQQRRWTERLADVEVLPAGGHVETLRAVKDAGEVARMARAAAIADTALGEVRSMLASGATELEVALALDTAMRRLGAEDRAFDTIVASGPNAAKPHATPTDRSIRKGDPVVVDFGAMFAGYRSDMTRTFCVGGAPSVELAPVFDVVGRAQAAGVAAVAPGVVTAEVDAACRNLITAAGFGEAFEHGTGHGVGLEIHEAPSVAAKATAILEAGVVVTVEPGVYLAGVGGVRVEDTVVVTDGGCHALTTFPKDIAA